MNLAVASLAAGICTQPSAETGACHGVDVTELQDQLEAQRQLIASLAAGNRKAVALEVKEVMASIAEDLAACEEQQRQAMMENNRLTEDKLAALPKMVTSYLLEAVAKVEPVLMGKTNSMVAAFENRITARLEVLEAESAASAAVEVEFAAEEGQCSPTTVEVSEPFLPPITGHRGTRTSRRTRSSSSTVQDHILMSGGCSSKTGSTSDNY